MKAPIALVALPLFAACAHSHGPGVDHTHDGGELVAAPVSTCNADAAQGQTGARATAEAGATMLAASGARQLRWAPPRSAMTMDYRADRLTVHYDDSFTITRIQCG
ncbi:MAG: I78 family peptidase inhibitor [Alteraurantiacibacter sp.]